MDLTTLFVLEFRFVQLGKNFTDIQLPVKIPIINCGIGVFYDTGLNLPVRNTGHIPRTDFFTDIQLPVKIPVINCGIGVLV